MKIEDWSDRNNRVIIYDIEKTLEEYTKRDDFKEFLIPSVNNHLINLIKNPPEVLSKLLNAIILA